MTDRMLYLLLLLFLYFLFLLIFNSFYIPILDSSLKVQILTPIYKHYDTQYDNL